MLIIMVRALILYILVILCVRLMGKRQIGQLQPAELVITILLSEVAAIPMENPDIPIINSISAALLLVSFEIVVSFVSMKSRRFRKIIQGNSLIVIRNGEIDQKVLKKLRFTIDDILESLRQKDVFDISEVKYAIAETNGSLSVMLKDENMPVTMKSAEIVPENNDLPYLIISDGKVLKDNMASSGVSTSTLNSILSKNKADASSVLLLTIDSFGNTNIILKEK